MSHREEDLAYGHYYGDSARGASGDTERGFVGDTFQKLKETYKTHQQQGSSNAQQSQYQQTHSQTQGSAHQYPPSYGNNSPQHHQHQQSTYHQQSPKPQKQDKLSGLFGKLETLGNEFAQKIGTALDPQAYAEYGSTKPQTQNRFGSFAPERQGNEVKWHVDGCAYFYAVSKALESARDYIWILDWWLSPELYLRRPPAKNEQYRLDRMLLAAAQRGVRVNIIVYKEVTQALTLSSHHTKHHLEDLHQNIAVFRHPDHLPDRQELEASIASSLQNLSLDAGNLAKMSEDTIKGLYGMHEDVILYWAHHEKLCIIDGRVAFMGGLDMCFGRWDTNQHALADVHGQDLNEIVFPGQDYNNARVLDFQDVANWEKNQLDRKKTSRMGWSDISVSLHGQVVEDLRRHFIERWNFIYDLKYYSRNNPRYSKLNLYGRLPSSMGAQQGLQQGQQPGQQQGQQQGQPAQQPATSNQGHSTPSWQQEFTAQPGALPTSPNPSTPSWQQQAASPQPAVHSGNAQASSASTQATPSWQQQAYQQPQQPASQQTSSYGSSAQPPTPSTPGWQQQQQTPSPQTGAYSGNIQHTQSWQQQHEPQQGGYQATSATPDNQATSSLQQQAPPAYTPNQAYTPSHDEKHNYTYTGDSFPPPPPGPPPSQGTSSNQQQEYGQHQGQAYSQQQNYTQPQGQSYPQQQTSTQSQAQPYPQQQTHTQSQGQGQSYSPSQSQSQYYPPPPAQEGQHSQTRGLHDYHSGGHGYGDSDRGFNFRGIKENITDYGNVLRGELAGQIHHYQDRMNYRQGGQPRGNMICQIVRSASKWSNGTPTEHSIQDAYAAIIRNSQHFVYIENQFFITATGDAQKPVENKIGAAIVERILRAARAGEKYKIVVVIPSVPCFAGDLSDDSTLGTRAIMEFQYNCINRGGSSIMELIAKEGYNPMDYIRFYNLRNYDRINVSGPLLQAENRSGVNYEEARKEHDLTTAGPGGYGPGAPRAAFDTTAPYQQYQQAAQQVSSTKSAPGRWDSVSECYMLNGPDIRNVPWDGPAEAEIDAFVTEELYVHSKVMIADDRVAIVGSANLNDRSQLGDHDSEIAIVIEDHTPIQSRMNGQQWIASRFAASLRRYLFRKHLGLLPPQDPERPDANFEPVGVPNTFDAESPESQIVADPLADTMHSMWNTRARTNTEVFRKVFHSVPDDQVRNWATYKEFYGYYFHNADKQAYGKDDSQPARYEYGHVVRDDFPPGPEGVKQVKELLSQVKGTLVEMPLMFLIEEDIAKEGLTLNELTEPIYT
ncbi:putative phospholipase D (PLD) [Aspergillus saccharolyticus JOP 1030-1]|uniref:phospholipase D n=1 Tax=Aspergillus saccharolyticus JOP 1030-1 TaxID=1450539 RepID=A0A318Z3E2_9EURO|nr:phospholipase D/nuclease [Aspergillus saccharolyticus JOP 1030-1]PYH41596.1 phospholipase D/nuclease [Aspergillus saccharolyticus JOP 1030-1]